MIFLKKLHIPQHLRTGDIGSHSGNNTRTDQDIFRNVNDNGSTKLPRIRMYWNPAMQIPSVLEATSVNRFFRFWSALHVTEADKNHSGIDKFLKDTVRKRC